MHNTDGQDGMTTSLVLIVEDNPDDSRILSLSFHRWGITNPIMIISNGKEAVEYLKSPNDNPMMIILDLNLGDMSGVELLREIRQHPCCRVIPVVICTGSDDADDWAKSYEAGANGFMVKPISFEQFVQVMLNIGMKWRITQ